jgi:uncharacterized protein YjbJ (UPF0337 family)
MAASDRASNKAQDLKGKTKEAAGKLIGNDELKNKGKADQAKSAVKDVGEGVKGAAKQIKDAVKRD